MKAPFLLQDLLTANVAVRPDAVAVCHDERRWSYAELDLLIRKCAKGLRQLGVRRGDRVAVWLEKRIETVVASFAVPMLGAAFVPINPVLKPSQVAHVLRDSGAIVLISSPPRVAMLAGEPHWDADLKAVAVDDRTSNESSGVRHPFAWEQLLGNGTVDQPVGCDSDMAAIFYTSGSTGRPKGVVVSHRNLVVGALSVAGYLQNDHEDVLLAALPLSFDAGFSQLTTGFHAGARVVLLNYLMPRDALLAMGREGVTGLTAVPPLYAQLVRSEWPANCAATLRYFASTGGRMPKATLDRLRAQVPHAKPVLMYGLTEAFRSTWLPPDEVDRRPGSIGKAIPNAEILVLRPDGSPCEPLEHGELVHRGALVSLGYWNNPQATAERFKVLPAPVRNPALPIAEVAVFSGDTAYADADGYLYFVGRRDEMIKTSGYRVSPTEVEEAVYASGMVAECAAFGVADEVLGEAICIVAVAQHGSDLSTDDLARHCRQALPAYMVPGRIILRSGSLPRNPNGKLDRMSLRAELGAVETP